MNSIRSTASSVYDIDATLRALGKAFESLQCALQGCRLYDPDHPAVRLSIQQAASGLQRVAIDGGTIQIGVASEALLWQGRELERSTAIDTLAKSLHALDIGAVECRTDVTSATLDAFMRALLEGRPRSLCGTALAQRIEEATGGALRAVPISYAGLSLVSGAKDPAAESGRAAVSWSDLVAGLSGLVEGGAAQSPEALAAAANECAARSPEQGVQALRTQLQDMASKVQSGGPDVDDATRERIEAFIGRLSPKLRRSLLHVDGDRPGQSLASMIDLSGFFRADDLLRALDEANLERAQVSDAAMLMFGKLRRILDGHTGERCDAQRLRELLQPAPVEGTDDEEMQASVSSLLHAGGLDDSTPDDYRANLESLVEPVAPGSFEISDGLDAQGNDLHAAEIAAYLIRNDNARFQKPGAYRRLIASIEDLLQAERPDLLLGACEAAHSLDRDGADDETVEAADDLLDAVRGPQLIGRLLDCAGSGDEESTAAIIGLLRLGGVLALRSMMDRTGIEGAMIAAVAAGCTNDEIAELVCELADRPEMTAARLRSLLESLPAERQPSATESLLAHPDPEVRRDALAIKTSRLGWQRHLLERALGDADPSLQTLALDELCRQEQCEEVAMLGAFIQGDLGNAMPDRRQCARAIRLLVECDGGPAYLARILRSMRWSILPRKAILASRLAWSMSRMCAEPTVRSALRLWRLSPANAVGAIARRLSRRGRDERG